MTRISGSSPKVVSRIVAGASPQAENKPAAASRGAQPSRDGFEASAPIRSTPVAAGCSAVAGLAHGPLILDTYKSVLRREPMGDAGVYWDRQLVELAGQGKSGTELASWLDAKLHEAVEGQALALADAVFSQVRGIDVSSVRTGLHELAVRMLRDEGKAADEVRETLKVRLASAASGVEAPSVGPVARDRLIRDAYAQCLRREPVGDATVYWDRQLVDLEAEGKSATELASWMRAKLLDVPEGRAMTMVDQAFSQLLGKDVSSRRTGLHERAIRLLRDEGKSADEVRAFLRERISNGSPVSTIPTIGNEKRDAMILDAYRACLRREPVGDASLFWDRQLLDLEIEGKGPAELESWLHDKLRSYPEGQAVELVDEAFAECAGVTVSARTGLHERAVRMMRDEGKSADEVRAFVRERFAQGPVATGPSIGIEARGAMILDAYRACLRREPVGDASLFWDRQLMDLETQGQGASQLREWLHNRLRSYPEGLALQLVDEAYLSMKGQDVSGSRTEHHEAAVRMMRDEGRSADEVRSWLQGQLEDIPYVWNGSTPAPGTTRTDAWNPVWSPVTSDESNRNPRRYDQVLNQLAVGDNPRYAPRGGATYCNIFVWDVTRAMGAEIPHWIDGAGNPVGVGRGRELDANANVDWLHNHGERFGWRQVSAEEAQEYANRGCPAMAAWKNPGGIGHVAMVRPGEVTDRGPAAAQAGGSNFNSGQLADGFGRIQPEYWVHA